MVKTKINKKKYSNGNHKNNNKNNKNYFKQ